MNNKSHLNKEQIVDKNGKVTHVYRKDANAAGAGSVSAGRVAASVPTPSIEPLRMSAPNKRIHVANLAAGEKVEMGYGDDYREELSNEEYPNVEARAFKVAQDLDVTGVAEYVGIEEDEGWKRRLYNVTLKNADGGKMAIPCYMGMGVDEVPSLSDALGGLAFEAYYHEAYNSFEEFADGMGYDPDEEGVREMFDTFEKNAAKLRAFVGSDDDYNYLVGK